ncbi:MAG: PBP1A family penicillin-binding protein [Anaerolineae bacterium]|nr:PBP1A family penicillin-binding protein [Anaerolineae bacterium]
MVEEPTHENEPAIEPHQQTTQRAPMPPNYQPDYYQPIAEAPPPRKRRRKGRWGCFKSGLAITAMVLAALVGSGLVIALMIYNSMKDEVAEDIATLESMEGVEDFETTRILDRSGTVELYQVITEGRRTEVPIEQIPFSLRWATIATEDDTFYENPGFDPASITRAAIQWQQEGEIVSGGSTITQQLVKMIVFEPEERLEQTLRRKLKEAALAYVMTREYSKDEILELYLNQIPYGNLAYGIEAAAQTYFDKPARDLTVAEASFLAGLPQSPATYDPYSNFAGAKVRQRQVLDLMVRHGYLSIAQADEAFNQPPTSVSDLASPNISLLAPHFTVEVRRQLGEIPGIEPDMIERGGLVVYTTIDMDMQALAEQIAAEQVAAVRDEYNLTNAAIIALNPHTGEVLAMLGSVDYANDEIDGAVNNTLSAHQPGSTMKPITYAAAMEQGWNPSDVLWDVPMVYDTGVGAYEPVNYDERFHGPVRLRDALANSYNIPAVTLAREVGVPGILEMSSRLGIESLGDDASLYGLSLTLGGGEVEPIEMATAFSAFANGGKAIEPIYITRITDDEGNVLYETPSQTQEQVIDPRIAFMISDILSDNTARTPAMGAESALLLDFPAAAKTGTTNDYRDNWTVGYTPHLVVAVWAGNTDNTPMAEGTSGLTGAAPIWHDYMTAVYALPHIDSLIGGEGLPPLRSGFSAPQGLEKQPVCVLSSLRDPRLAEEGCPLERDEWFRIGTSEWDPEPTPTLEPTPSPTPDEEADEGDEEEEHLPPLHEEVSEGLWQISVLAMNEDQQAALVELMADSWDALPDDLPTPATPKYCVMSADIEDVEGAAVQLFISAPDDEGDAIRARNWALANGIPIEPGILCPTEDLGDTIPADLFVDADTGSMYAIDDPNPGDEVYGIHPIIGTAIFDPAEIQYYKLEIGPGEFPTEWITFGGVHTEPVEDGVLEELHADASDVFPPGPYVVRLVLVRQDSNYLTPFTVPITIVPVPEDSGE